MLQTPEEVQAGQTVWLYPQTKQASANVHRMLAVRILKDPKAHWPMIVVGWSENGADAWELVHRDNIRKRSAAATTTKDETKQGDAVGGGQTSSKRGANRVRVMPNAKKYEPTDEQMELF